MVSVDLNCDMGEGMENDAALMPYISSANIACGYHAGDTDTIRRTLTLCQRYTLSVGVHPSFNDRVNFGRIETQLTDNALYDLVTDQLQLFALIAKEEGVPIHHVKPHGALYNMAAKNRQMAAVIANAVFSFDKQLILYGLAGSCLIEEGRRAGLATAAEAFADRTYQPDGFLTPRSMPNALHSNKEVVVKQVLQMAKEQTVTTTTGTAVSLKADTICIHGDGEYAVLFAKAIHTALQAEGMKISAL